MCRCESFCQQLNELRLINSIYPDQVIIHDKDVKLLVERDEEPNSDKDHDHPVNFYFIQKENNETVYEIEFSLNRNYPSQKVSAHVRLYNESSKQKQTLINQQLLAHINGNSSIDVYSVILWVADWIENGSSESLEMYNAGSSVESECSSTISSLPETASSDSGPICRLWIISHHIYSKEKRKMILEGANYRNLKGFTKPGKPGFMCFEGPEDEAESFWKWVKGFRWQKINLIDKECPVKESLFSTFEELALDNSDFVRFLEVRDLNRIVRAFLGLSQKI